MGLAKIPRHEKISLGAKRHPVVARLTSEALLIIYGKDANRLQARVGFDGSLAVIDGDHAALDNPGPVQEDALRILNDEKFMAGERAYVRTHYSMDADQIAAKLKRGIHQSLSMVDA